MEGYEEFKKQVYQMTKIDLSLYKEKQMRRRIDSLVTKHHLVSYPDYVKLLRDDKDVFGEFVNFLTINVSEFYRNPDQWQLLDKEYFPYLIQKFGRSLKIWSAACSTGDEPYSLVMALSKHVPLSNIRIDATDIDKQVLAQAKTGLYNEKSIKSVPNDLKAKYFTKVGTSYQISEDIKKRVSFHEGNLLKDAYPSNCDLIVCRNVVIYFTDEAKHDIYSKFAKSLKQGGLLFIGSTEQIMEYRELGFKRRSSFFYEKE
ncbi:MAG: protein-glutamate O-methyltransferase CheR [Lachnospiraceae bacterium]|uniref:protein-glutamate O-methyltransferase n=1 Tax=Candidatus Weimeria bifida TaxID=2599074 RepID=A0A6N7IWE8_9FIRM|nr:protein-glutamate O-methyltransferase CheR [Candidatus Weimeria bifida]RRF96023.1 MAG: protein-glutamate O-methyltransferase CheR [Lachnospiraceae bacterium]